MSMNTLARKRRQLDRWEEFLEKELKHPGFSVGSELSSCVT